MSAQNQNNSMEICSGVINRGYDYEHLVPSFFALKLLLDENVKTFELKLNASPYGKFDDLILEIEYKDGGNEKFAIQLKHREEQNSTCQAPREFNRRDSKGKGKAFNISEYKKKYRKADGYKFILYTNAGFANVDKVNYYNITSCLNPFRTNLFDVDGIYQFENLYQTCSTFYDNFFLFSEQKNVEALDLEIKKIFKEKFFCGNEQSIKTFLAFFEKLRKRDYKTTKINKDEVILHLTYILLFNYIITPSITQDSSKKLELLEKAFKKFDITIVLGQKRDIIDNKWKNFLPHAELQSKLKIAKDLKFLTTSEEASTEKLSKILAFVYGPLFLHSNNDSETTINSIAPLIKTLETLKLNLVLIGEKVPEVTFQPLTTFENLEDLANEEFYQEFLKFFKVSLQGRRPESMMKLKNIGFDLKLITPNEIFQLLEGNLKIGEAIEELPEFYIPRTLLRTELTLNQLRYICTQNTTIIHCEKNSNQFQQDLQKEGFDVVSSTTHRENLLNERKHIVVLRNDKNTERDESSFYHLKLNENNLLEWAQNKVNLDHKNSFENSLNILYGDPGAGKTTMLKYLASRHPSNHLIIRIPAHKINFCFNSDQDILKQFPVIREESETDKRICAALLEKKKVVLLFDGLNEVKKGSLEKAIEGIRHFSRDGYKIWISSTPNLKEYLESTLGISCSYVIEDLTAKSRKKYIHDKLKKSEIKEDVIKATIQKMFEENAEGILKLPLILYLLTEILRTHPKILHLEEDLTLHQMYWHFFEGQVKHYIQKQGCNYYEELIDVIDTFQMSQLQFYQIAALRTCLLPVEFKQLGLKMDKNFFEKMKQNGDPLDFVEINQDDTFTFRHHTFLEYFAASWISKNYNEISVEARRFILKAEYDGIRKFFNQDMTEKCPLHLAILNQDLKQIEEYAKRRIKDVDKAGRNAFHLAVSMGEKYPILTIDYLKNNYYKIKKKKSTQQKEILKLLLEAATEEDLLRKDEFLEWNAFEYADASLCLSALEELSKKEEFSWNYLKNYKDLFTLTYYCVTMGYSNLLKKIIAKETLPRLEAQHKEKPLLHLALENGYTRTAHLLIEKGANLTAQDNQKKTPLHMAAMWGNLEIVSLLLDKVEVDPKDNLGKTPLEFAARMGHIEVAKLLVEKGANVNTIDDEKKSPLHKAAFSGHTEMVKFLIEKGGNVNELNVDERGPLQRAVEMGHYGTVECLVENGADINAFDKLQKTSLHYAAYEGHEDIVKYLLGKKVDVHAKDEDEKTARKIAKERNHLSVEKILSEAESSSTQVSNTSSSSNSSKIHDAAYKGDLRMFRKLLNAKNIEEVNSYNDTLLHVASSRGHLRVVNHLIQKKARTDAVDNVGRIPLHLACHHGHLEVVKQLLNRGQNSFVDKWKQTPLHRAAYKGHKKIVELLVDAKVDINCKDDVGATPVHSAASGDHKDVIEYLISKGANIEEKNDKKETCLHVAAQKGCIKVVDYLVKKKELLDLLNFYERTALHLAAEKGYKIVAKILVEGGADINKVDNLRQTALDIAKRGSRKGIVEILQNHSNK